jgi:glycosyltransferase involved in cell wall biosynthesis
MNYIFIETGKNLGGIENFLIETIKKLVAQENNVYLISRTSTTIYHKELVDLSNFKIINLQVNKRVEYLTNKDIGKIKSICDKTLKREIGEKDSIVICPFFDNFQLGLLLFSEETNYKLFHVWGHPEDWVKTLRIYNNNGFNLTKIKNKKYFYQKSLLSKLFIEDAEFYAGRIVPVYNSWYYETKLSPENIYSFPIEDLKEPYQEISYNPEGEFKVLWVGRFDEWKNEAIIHISSCLDELAHKTGKYISFNIIGFGSEENTFYVKDNITSNYIEVNFLNYVRPHDLPNLMKEYHLGIGMGLSVKKLAQVGLPSIVIDSVDKKNVEKIKAEWLFKTTEGDAGDGFYFQMVGKPLENRHYLIDLLNEIIDNPHLVGIYGRKSREFVIDNYSQEKQINNFILCSNSSRFYGVGYKVYRRNVFFRMLFEIYSVIKNISK